MRSPGRIWLQPALPHSRGLFSFTNSKSFCQNEGIKIRYAVAASRVAGTGAMFPAGARGAKSSPGRKQVQCETTAELDMKTLVWTRGELFPLDQLVFAVVWQFARRRVGGTGNLQQFENIMPLLDAGIVSLRTSCVLLL